MPLVPGAGYLLVQRTTDLDTHLGRLRVLVDGRPVARLRHGERRGSR